MKNVLEIFKKYWLVVLFSFFILVFVGFLEYSTGRSVFGPDGKFGLWESSIYSSENSQRVADAYTFSHIIHGMLFYGLLWVFARKVPARYRFVMALGLEAGWELLENSPIIIDRYRSVTVSLGYVGDSVLNSLSDIVFAGTGFIISRFSKFWVSVLFIVMMEVGCLFWVRDNLTLNIVMLLYPIKSIQVWQSAGNI